MQFSSYFSSEFHHFHKISCMLTMLLSRGCTFSLHFLKLERLGGVVVLWLHISNDLRERNCFLFFEFSFRHFVFISFILRCARPPSGPFMKLPGRFVEHRLWLMWLIGALSDLEDANCRSPLQTANLCYSLVSLFHSVR